MIPRFRIALGLSAALLLCLFALTVGALAQGEAISDTAVIRVAGRMYCPVCENIPLDECQTVACHEWKDEIRARLGAGQSEQAIIDSFVSRFGDDVVGVPQDPLLRALAAVVPALATALALGVGVAVFRRFSARQKLSLAHEPRVDLGASDAEYRRRLEEDVRARR